MIVMTGDRDSTHAGISAERVLESVSKPMSPTPLRYFATLSSEISERAEHLNINSSRPKELSPSPRRPLKCRVPPLSSRQRILLKGLTITMSDTLLKIQNHHTASCGDPPIVDGSAENCYLGYFENPYGEQWIFTMDRGTGKATLQGGDVGWNTKFDVTNGTVADLILGQEEQLWLQACWSSARKQVRRD